jgi:hypothetical protein
MLYALCFTPFPYAHHHATMPTLSSALVSPMPLFPFDITPQPTHQITNGQQAMGQDTQSYRMGVLRNRFGRVAERRFGGQSLFRTMDLDANTFPYTIIPISYSTTIFPTFFTNVPPPPFLFQTSDELLTRRARDGSLNLANTLTPFPFDATRTRQSFLPHPSISHRVLCEADP